MKNGVGHTGNDAMKAHLDARRRMVNARLDATGQSHRRIPAGTPTAFLPGRIAAATALANQPRKRTPGSGAKRPF
jgi:hypothetical protein